jgi:hypothetical protein
MESVIPDFASRRMGNDDARRLCNAAAVDLDIGPIAPMGLVTPKIGGVHTIYVSDEIPVRARAFVILHELAHVVNGDAEELTIEVLDGSRYPLKDQVADAVAALGVTSRADRELPAPDLADLLRTLVPIPHRAWTIYRSNEVAAFIRSAPERRWRSA